MSERCRRHQFLLLFCVVVNCLGTGVDLRRLTRYLVQWNPNAWPVLQPHGIIACMPLSDTDQTPPLSDLGQQS
eukprot:m.240535 g.240535  ORF g.240535 m.240535 type:complete len:73 (-) comp26284_c0_seq3:735-953(-)